MPSLSRWKRRSPGPMMIRILRLASTARSLLSRTKKYFEKNPLLFFWLATKTHQGHQIKGRILVHNIKMPPFSITRKVWLFSH
ncbi:hypothetical protein BN1200_270045 [Klebsiella variicola]|nr:hypothetical protein BN1200_270045 [Klebsiella variicola]CTQ24925.1 hypothetical protein BN1200_660002 [Klebsiella variicola]